MKAENLSAAVKRTCQTTKSFDGCGQWGNRLENLDICRRNQVWVGDITYVRLKEQFVYVRVNGRVHPNDKRLATESALDRTSHIETVATGIKPKRSRKFTIVTKGFSIFRRLIFPLSLVMELRFP